MQLRAGDRLRCSNPECRLEVLVLESASKEEHNRLPECWCGWPMSKRTVEPPRPVKELAKRLLDQF